VPPNFQKSEPRKEDIMKRCMPYYIPPGIIVLLCVLSMVQGDNVKCRICSENPQGFPSKYSSSLGIWLGYCNDENDGQLQQECGPKSNECITAAIEQECIKETEGELESYFPRNALTLEKEIKGCWNQDQTEVLEGMIEACGGKVNVQTCQDKDNCNAAPPPSAIATETIAVVVVIAVVAMILGFLTWGCWRHERACFSQNGSKPISTDAEMPRRRRRMSSSSDSD